MIHLLCRVTITQLSDDWNGWPFSQLLYCTSTERPSIHIHCWHIYNIPLHSLVASPRCDGPISTRLTNNRFLDMTVERFTEYIYTEIY